MKSQQVMIDCTVRAPSRIWKPGDLNFICPDSEIGWNLSQKVRKPGQNKTFRIKKWIKPGMLRYTKFQY